MTDFEKAYRKMELKEQSGMNSDKEMAEALSALVFGPDGKFEYEPEKYEKEAREGFLKVFGIIPKADYEENISMCLEMLNELKEQINKFLTTMEMIPAVKACVTLEPKLAAVCNLLFWELERSRKVITNPKDHDTEPADPLIRFIDICYGETYEEAFEYYQLVVVNIELASADIVQGKVKKEYSHDTDWVIGHIPHVSKINISFQKDREEGLL